MAKLIGSLFIASIVLAGCGDDDDDQAVASETEAFCAEFQQTGATGSGIATGFGGATDTSVGEALVYFRRLEDTAPEEISDEVATVTEGLSSLSEAFAEFQGVEGEEAFEAVSQAAEVDLEEVRRAAEDVEGYARNNCEDVDTSG